MEIMIENTNRQIKDYTQKANKVKNAAPFVLIIVASFVSRFRFDFENRMQNSVLSVVALIVYASTFIYAYYTNTLKARKLQNKLDQFKI